MMVNHTLNPRCWHTLVKRCQKFPDVPNLQVLTYGIPRIGNNNVIDNVHFTKIKFFFTIDNVWWIKHGAYVNLKKIFLKYFLSIRELDELNKRLEVILICCWFCFSVFFLFIPSYRNLLSIIVTSWTPVPCYCVIFWTNSI